MPLKNKTRKTRKIRKIPKNGFKYDNSEVRCMTGGGKVLRCVKIRNGKGYKSMTYKRGGKKAVTVKKMLKNAEVNMIKMGKFIPGLFKECLQCKK